MISREEILSAYKQSKFPDKLFDESIKNIKNYIFYKESTQPSSEKTKDNQKLSESYVLPRRILMQKNIQVNPNNKNEFFRGGNFTPKEPVIDINIDNLKLIYDKFSIPVETNIIYTKNTYGGINGPYNLEHIKNMYKNKKIDSNNEFRLIDIFSFKDSEIFSFQSLKIINDEKWIDLIIDNPLINYSDLFKNINNVDKIENIEKKESNEANETNENKENESKEQESEVKIEKPKKKKKKVKSKEIKGIKEEEKVEKVEKVEKSEKAEKVEKSEKNEKIEKKEENNVKEEMDSSEKLEIKISKEKKENNEELIEILKRKKIEKDKEKMKDDESQKEENIKQDNVKNEDKKDNEFKETRYKKGKKKKKAQFEETEIDLGFQIK